MPKAAPVKMVWYICTVSCTLDNLKKKRNTALKTGKTAVASGQTQPIADYVDDRPHDIEYIDYTYQDMPGNGGAKAPANLISYYGAANIKQTTYTEAPPTGVPLHVLDSNGQMEDDETLYKKGFDKSGFPIFWDGETYIKEKKLYLQHLHTPFKQLPRFFNDLIPDPNTSNSGEPKNIFEKYYGAKDADIKKIALKTALDETDGNIGDNDWSIDKTAYISSYTYRKGDRRWEFYINNSLLGDTAPKRLLEIIYKLGNKIPLWVTFDGGTYSLAGADLQKPPTGYADGLFEDDNLKNILLKHDHRGIVDFWRLFSGLQSGLSPARWVKLRKILDQIGYSTSIINNKSRNDLINTLKTHNSGNRFLPNAWGVLVEVAKSNGGTNQFVNKIYDNLNSYSSWGVSSWFQGNIVRARINARTLVSIPVSSYFSSAYLAISKYINYYFPSNNPRKGGTPDMFTHIFEETNPDKLITHRILEQLHIQTRKKPYVPKNPVTHDPAVHVDAATHEKISHNIHDTVMKKNKKTAYTYGDHKPKDSKNLVIEQSDIDAIMKPHKDALLKHQDASKKTTIWDI